MSAGLQQFACGSAARKPLQYGGDGARPGDRLICNQYVLGSNPGTGSSSPTSTSFKICTAVLPVSDTQAIQNSGPGLSPLPCAQAQRVGTVQIPFRETSLVSGSAVVRGPSVTADREKYRVAGHGHGDPLRKRRRRPCGEEAASAKVTPPLDRCTETGAAAVPIATAIAAGQLKSARAAIEPRPSRKNPSLNGAGTRRTCWSRLLLPDNADPSNTLQESRYGHRSTNS